MLQTAPQHVTYALLANTCLVKERMILISVSCALLENIQIQVSARPSVLSVLSVCTRKAWETRLNVKYVLLASMQAFKGQLFVKIALLDSILRMEQ